MSEDRWIFPERVAVGLLGAFLAFSCVALYAQETASEDAFARFDPQTKTWTLGTSMIEEKIQLAYGAYRLASLENKLTRFQYSPESSLSGEFRVTVDGAVYTGTIGNWS
jgi:hypothetical protein